MIDRIEGLGQVQKHTKQVITFFEAVYYFGNKFAWRFPRKRVIEDRRTDDDDDATAVASQ